MENKKKEQDIVFVILHYISIADTNTSIKSIENNIDTESYHIIVVDNGSPNRTGLELKKEYEGSQRVSVILSNENVGFARGNNLGITYARENYEFAFLAVLNNDIYLLERDLFKKLKTEYGKSGFAVLGPMILTAEGKCNINPGRNRVISRQEVEHKIARYKKQIFFGKIYLGWLYEWLLKVYHKCVYLPRNPVKAKHKIYTERQEMVQLHGCFLVFSPQYFNCLQGFDERTFLYMEEDILFAKIVEKKLKSVYVPDIMVFHNEDRSTDESAKHNDRKKKLFMRTNYVNSAKVLLEVLDEMNTAEAE